MEGGRVIAYSLAYINHRRCSVDNGRLLGYDDSHGYHHRHFMGKVEAVKKLSRNPIQFILNTSFHADHTGGNAKLAAAG